MDKLKVGGTVKYIPIITTVNLYGCLLFTCSILNLMKATKVMISHGTTSQLLTQDYYEIKRTNIIYYIGRTTFKLYVCVGYLILCTVMFLF